MLGRSSETSSTPKGSSLVCRTRWTLGWLCKCHDVEGAEKAYQHATTAEGPVARHAAAHAGRLQLARGDVQSAWANFQVAAQGPDSNGEAFVEGLIGLGEVLLHQWPSSSSGGQAEAGQG